MSDDILTAFRDAQAKDVAILDQSVRLLVLLMDGEGWTRYKLDKHLYLNKQHGYMMDYIWWEDGHWLTTGNKIRAYLKWTQTPAGQKAVKPCRPRVAA